MMYLAAAVLETEIMMDFFFFSLLTVHISLIEKLSTDFVEPNVNCSNGIRHYRSSIIETVLGKDVADN